MEDQLDAATHAELGNFAKALALSSSESTKKLEAWQPWAYFRLGMYATVAALPIRPSDSCYIERHLLPYLVSVAACGDHSRVVELISSVSWAVVPKKLRISIAKSLSFYLPEESLALVSDVLDEMPLTLCILLLQRAGHMDEARCRLDKAISDGLTECYPELYLYKMALNAISPAQQIEQFNRLAAVYGIDPLVLLDSNVSLNPCNVRVPNVLPAKPGPLVTVLMTTFNAGERFSSAIESTLMQSYENLDIVVVDDASSDNTVDIIKEWINRDRRVRLIRLDNNVGTYMAKSIGLNHARGDFVTCQDSDDWSHPQKIELQMSPLLKNKNLIATVSCGVRIHDDGTVNTSSHVDLVHLNYSSILFRKERVMRDTGGWDCGVRMSADTEFFWRLRLIYGEQSIHQVRGPLSLLSYRSGTLTTSHDNVGFQGSRFPSARLAYLESFNAWHIHCLRNGKIPVGVNESNLMDWLNDRPYAAPIEMRVDPEQARYALKNAEFF